MRNLNKIFKKSKTLSLDDYLYKVLYNKQYGYYSKNNPFGIKGDYITAPNISILFCEMIAIWFVSFWESLNKPNKINFVELGPGNGDLCVSFIKTLRNFPKLYNATNIMLYEKSQKLKKIQKKRINSNKVSWINDLKLIKKNPTIFFGNEFLDALPIKQFKKVDNNIYEKYVSFKNDKLNFIFKKALKKQISKLEIFNLTKSKGIIEFPEHGFRELDIVCSKIKKLNGGALFIDYGYKSQNGEDTLQSVMKHKINNINENIGKADITYLVNFELYKKYFILNGLNVEKIITQSEFLQKMGIIERAKIIGKNMGYKDKSNLYYRVQRLINPDLMGKRFKVIFARNKKNNFSTAFK